MVANRFASLGQRSNDSLPGRWPLAAQFMPIALQYDAIMDEAGRTLLDKALALDESDRAHLATELLRSLDEPGSDSQEAVDRLWAIEIERRSDRVRSDESQGVPWDEVRSHIVAETWNSHGPRSNDAAFDPQEGDDVTVGDDDEPPVRGHVTRRDGNKVWVQLDPGRSVAPSVAPHGQPSKS